MEEQIELVENRIKEARLHDLLIEVMCYALRFMKTDPALSIIMAVDLACQEWDV
ncbi:MAG: hypothetical protein H7X88_01755 [Gloeobacteraceae cyanobacterium ES-bin-316]|nr:hypothetical protein [Ferruginibacter sp.]